MRELKELKKSVVVLHEKVEKLENPELMMERIKQRKEEIVKESNKKMLNPF